MTVTLSLLLACTSTDPAPEAPTVDLVSPLGPGEVRAGVVTDPRALFGGVSAEGRPGDVKIYNDRVRFIIQGAVPSSFYLSHGGGVVDADVVRPEGEPGRDLVDDWSTVVALTHLLEPTELEVLHDGSDGQPAHVVVRGVEGALAVVEGLIESPGTITPLGVEIEQHYVLAPDAWTMEVTTLVTPSTTTTLYVGDLLVGAPEVARPWWQHTGFVNEAAPGRRHAGWVADDRDVAVAMIAAPGDELRTGAAAILTELTDMVIGFSATVEQPAGETLTWTRRWGVGPDLATITDEVLAEEATDTVSGVVTAPDGPVAGAWVPVLVDESPYTLAVTGPDGAFSARVPAGATARALAVGDSHRRFLDRPPEAVPYGAYGVDAARAPLLASWSGQGSPRAVAEGRGVSDDLGLGEPARLRLSAADGRPFTAWLDGGEGAGDPRFAPGRPSGHAAVAFARSGSVEIAVPPGTYDLLAHRGMRFEIDRQQVTLAAGAVTELTVTLPAGYDHAGWLLADPHSHAAPSGDAAISMDDRLTVHASAGVQVHFGTDHDQVADYSPLIAAMGLGDALRTVVADEVSPPLRGHFNIYPVPSRDAANGGAWTWWLDIPESTDDLVARLRDRYGPDFIVQSNHPTDSGMGSSAGWSPGRVMSANRWTSNLEAVELMNSGDYDDFLPFYLDLLLHGVLVAPVGVSDSHGHLAGHTGFSGTWIATSAAAPADFSDAMLTEAMRARRTVVSNGPFLDVDVAPGGVVAPGTVVEVTARTPSWFAVDRLVLLRDGVEVERVDGATATFTLDADADAAFHIVAEGDTPMAPVDSGRPWAMTAGYLVDVGGDGWEAPWGVLEGL